MVQLKFYFLFNIIGLSRAALREGWKWHPFLGLSGKGIWPKKDRMDSPTRLFLAGHAQIIFLLKIGSQLDTSGMNGLAGFGFSALVVHVDV